MCDHDLTLAHVSDTDRARYINTAEAHKLPRLPNHAIRSALSVQTAPTKRALVPLAPRPPAVAATTNPNPPPEHLNPVAAVLQPRAALPPYLDAPKAMVYPILCLRSAHLPCDSGPAFRSQYASSYCRLCDEQVLPDEDRARMTTNEAR